MSKIEKVNELKSITVTRIDNAVNERVNAMLSAFVIGGVPITEDLRSRFALSARESVLSEFKAKGYDVDNASTVRVSAKKTAEKLFSDDVYIEFINAVIAEFKRSKLNREKAYSEPVYRCKFDTLTGKRIVNADKSPVYELDNNGQRISVTNNIDNNEKFFVDVANLTKTLVTKHVVKNADGSCNKAETLKTICDMVSHALSYCDGSESLIHMPCYRLIVLGDSLYKTEHATATADKKAVSGKKTNTLRG